LITQRRATPYGKKQNTDCALKGQNQCFFDVALSGRRFCSFIFVGRCPTLGYFAPLGRFLENQNAILIRDLHF